MIENLKTRDMTLILACLQAVTGGFITENPFRSLIERHLGFLRRALPGTSGRAQKSREGEGVGRENSTKSTIVCIFIVPSTDHHHYIVQYIFL